jgi:hypothetical protein
MHYLEHELEEERITEDEYRLLQSLFSIISVLATGTFLSRLAGRLRLTVHHAGIRPLLDIHAGGAGDVKGADGAGDADSADGEGGAGGAGGTSFTRLQEIFWASTGDVGEMLVRKYNRSDEIHIGNIVEDLTDTAGDIIDRVFGEGLYENFYDEYDKALKQSFYLERRMMHRYLEEGRITDEEADRIRVEINKLETFAIEDVHNEMGRKLFERRIRRRRKRRKARRQS